MSELDLDVLIIGAGPAGALAASALNREGFKIDVVEKQTFPRFVIGESLLPHSMDLLQDAGLLDAVERQGFMRKHGAVFLRGAEVCNFDFANQSGGGWDYTYQVTRADFDKTLADTVAAQGVRIDYGQTVTAVDFNKDRAAVTVKGAEGASRTVAAKFVLDCSGYGRVLPRLLDLEKPANSPPKESMFTHVSGDARPLGREEGKIWVCMHPQGAWIWIIPFSNGNSSVGVVADPEFFKKFSGTEEERLRAMIMGDENAAARLGQAKILFPPQSIKGYSCAVKRLWGPRYALTGNASEFLDPIFSSGVTLALESANRAVHVLTRHLRGEPVNWDTEYSEYVMQGVNTFRAYVMAWYNERLPQIFFAAQRNPDIMRQICSVLAGYVWDESNPFVHQAERAIGVLSELVRLQAGPAGAR